MNLETQYLGLTLQHPILPSAGPLTDSVSNIRRLEDGGAPAIVMHSLFEEQIAHESKVLDHYLEYGSESFAEALSYFPQAEDYRVGPEKYLEHIEEARKAVDVPIIGSLNGVTTGGWIDYARRIQDAGADALELNIYHIPVDPEVDAVQVEQLYVDIVSAVTSRVGIPVAVKIGPFFSAPVNMARKLVNAGAAGLVIFNRFYQPDFDLENLEVEPKLVLSDSHELRLPLRWTAIMHSHVNTDLAITSGVHNSYDVLKCMLAGAKVAMMTSELLQHGIGRIKEIRDAVEQWLEENDYESLQQMQGSMSQKHVPHPEAFERANYQKALQSWKPDPLGSMRERL